jgi:hypothetical protein
MRGAFVVRLGLQTDPARGQFKGWVEEVDTGKRLKFQSTEELRREQQLNQRDVQQEDK